MARRTKINWKTLDACETAEELRDLLKSKGIKGDPNEPYFCPLARATGWSIADVYAESPSGKTERNLTAAEIAFVELFDNMRFPELVRNEDERLNP